MHDRQPDWSALGQATWLQALTLHEGRVCALHVAGLDVDGVARVLATVRRRAALSTQTYGETFDQVLAEVQAGGHRLDDEGRLR